MRRLVLVLILALGLLLGGCGSKQTTYERIDPAELSRRIAAKEGWTVVDLREPVLYKRGHVPGAINIPFDEFGARMGELKPGQKVAFVCHTGPMGETTSQLLVQKGYANVVNLKGGMAAWQGDLER